MIALSSETTVGDCQLFIVFSQFIMALQYESLQCSVRGRDCLEELPLPSLIITQIGSFHVCNYIREDRNNKKYLPGQIDTMQNSYSFCQLQNYFNAESLILIGGFS